jgi:spermidine/putrescine ABC transporter ATP-binding subunit
MTGDPTRGERVEIKGVTYRFGRTAVLDHVDLDVAAGEFLTLLGPSGSGKTTLLRLLGGMLDMQQGRVSIGSRDVTHMPPRQRRLGFVFQNYALFPHLTVFQNVAFPLRLRKIPKAEVADRVHRVLNFVSLSELAGRMPDQLSGGQQQRVALARAVVFEPLGLLMDEPLGALDKRLRRQLQIEMRRYQQKLGITTIYVTHDQEEAFTMSDRIAVMHEGVIQQVGEPPEIYHFPANRFVADFVGDTNTLEGVLHSSTGADTVLRTTDGLEVRVCAADKLSGAPAQCGVRPERIRVGASVDADNVYRGVIRRVRFVGSYLAADIEIGGGVVVTAELREEPGAELSPGAEVEVGWDASDTMIFRSASATLDRVVLSEKSGLLAANRLPADDETRQRASERRT